MGAGDGIGRGWRGRGRAAAALALSGLLGAVAVLFVAGGGMAPAGLRWDARPGPIATDAPAVSASPGDQLSAARAIVAPAARPARLLVPAIQVDATVEAVGLDGQGRMAAPSRADRVGWYRPGAVPGDAGNAVFDGHLDWTDGPAVFWRLDKLRRGDELVVVRADGSRARFLVETVVLVPYDAATEGMFTLSGPPSLTLITCAGDWDRQRATYAQRLVVRAALAPAAPTERPGDEGG